jgi:hypothetical protein
VEGRGALHSTSERSTGRTTYYSYVLENILLIMKHISSTDRYTVAKMSISQRIISQRIYGTYQVRWVGDESSIKFVHHAFGRRLQQLPNMRGWRLMLITYQFKKGCFWWFWWVQRKTTFLVKTTNYLPNSLVDGCFCLIVTRHQWKKTI